MLFTPKLRFSENRQRRLKSATPRIEVLENRLQPGSVLLGQELALLTANLAPLDPASTRPADEPVQVHFRPSTGNGPSKHLPAVAMPIPAVAERTTNQGAVAQPAAPAVAATSPAPFIPNGGLAPRGAQLRPVVAAAPAVAQAAVGPTPAAQPLKLVQALIPMISQQTQLSAAPAHAPVQPQTFGGKASQNWATYVTGTATIATGRGLALDANGNIYVTGATDAGTTKQAFVAAYDPSGNPLFNTKFQAIDVATGIHYNHSQGQAIALDGQGNIYVTGQATNPSTRLQDAFVMRLDSSGHVDPNYGVGFDTGGLGNVSGNGIGVAPDGTATIVGTARFVGNDIFIAQVAASGSVNYGNAFPPVDFQDSSGNGLYRAVAASGVALSPDGSMAYVSGTGTHADGSNDIIVTLIDTATGSQPTGFSAVSSPGGTGSGIVVGADGTVYQTGTTTIQVNGQASTYAVAISWTADLTTTNYAVYDNSTPSITGTGIAVDPTGNVYLTGTATDILGNTRALVELLDPAGQIADTLLIAENGSGVEAGWGIAYSPDGTVYVTGDTSSSNLSTDGSSLNGQQDAFLANVGSFMN